MKRTSLVLGTLALAMLGFILLFERGSVTSGELEQRKGRVLDRFVRERVSRIEVQRKGVTTVLARGPDKETGLALGSWMVEQPYASKADTEAVDALLGELEWIDPKRSLSNVSAEDLARFGLDKPRYRVSFTVGNERVSFSVGKEDPQSEGAYLQVGDTHQIYVVAKDVVAGFDHDAASFHTKELHDGVSIYTAKRISLRDARDQRTEYVIEKRGDYFWLTKPEIALASQPTINAIVAALDALRATHYVSSDLKRLHEYGLDAPAFEMNLNLRSFDEKAKDKFRLSTLRIRVGGACPGALGESYVIADEGSIMCAADAELDKLRTNASALRESRLLILEDPLVHGVHVRSGNTELALEQEGDGWRYKVLDHGQIKQTGPADTNAVVAWFAALRDAQAEERAVAAPLSASAARANAAIVASFDRGKDKPAYEVRLGRHEAGRIAVTRLDEAVLLWFPEKISELLLPASAQFRKPRLLDEPLAAFTRLQLTRENGVSEIVSKDATGYHFTGPATTDAERLVVDEIVRLVSALEALRFVSDAPTSAQGLAHPAYVLRIHYAARAAASNAKPEPEREHVLKLGALTDGGRFAQLDADPAVFVAPQVLLDQLRQPLVSRGLLALALEQLGSLKIEHGGKTVRVERATGPDDASGNHFVVPGARDGDRDRAMRLASAIATLRAVGVDSFGKAAASMGLQQPQARITVQPRTGVGAAPYTLSIGAPASLDDHSAMFGRRSDLDVNFTLPRESVDALLETAPATAAPAPAPAPTAP